MEGIAEKGSLESLHYFYLTLPETGRKDITSSCEAENPRSLGCCRGVGSYCALCGFGAGLEPGLLRFD